MVRTLHIRYLSAIWIFDPFYVSVYYVYSIQFDIK